MSAAPALFPAAFAGIWLWLSGFAPPVSAEETATAIAAPAARYPAANVCRIVAPTYPLAAAPETAQEARYPGGGRLSFAVAAPCPERIVALDI